MTFTARVPDYIDLRPILQSRLRAIELGRPVEELDSALEEMFSDAMERIKSGNDDLVYAAVTARSVKSGWLRFERDAYTSFKAVVTLGAYYLSARRRTDYTMERCKRNGKLDVKRWCFSFYVNGNPPSWAGWPKWMDGPQ